MHASYHSRPCAARARPRPDCRQAGGRPGALRRSWMLGRSVWSASASSAADASSSKAPRRPRRRPPMPAMHPSPAASSGAAAADALGCPLFSKCSGCTLDTGLHSPPAAAEAAAFFAARGVPGFKVVAGPVAGWRCRAKLAVGGAPGRPRLGLYRGGTHDVLDILPGCRTHHPALNTMGALVHQLAASLGIQVFEPPAAGSRGAGNSTGSGASSGAGGPASSTSRRSRRQRAVGGGLRHVQLTVVAPQPGQLAEQAAEPQVQVVLVWGANSEQDDSMRPCRQLAQAIWTYGGGGGASIGGASALGRITAGRSSSSPAGAASPQAVVHSVWAHLHADASDNRVLGGAGPTLLLHGPEQAWQQFGAAALALPPAAFVQANYSAMQGCLARVAALVPPGSAVAELFAGSGAIGLHLLAAGRAGSVTCVEVNPACRQGFDQAVSQLPAALRSQARLHVAAAGEAPARWLAGADVLVVDPPRKGLGPQLLDALCSPDPGLCPPALARLVYVSCGWAAFQADCDALLASGRWRLAAGPGAAPRAFLFFPGTDSLETVALLERCA